MNVATAQHDRGNLEGTGAAASLLHDEPPGSELAENLLATVSDMLATSLDFAVTIERVAQLVARTIGDFCNIRLLSSDGTALTPSAYHHVNHQALAMLRALGASGPRSISEGVGGQVIRTGEPVFVSGTAPAEMQLLLPSRLAPYLDHFGMHSLMIVPLRVRGRVLGTMTTWRDRPSPPYTRSDLTSLQALADRAALAIDNALLYTAEREARASAEAAQRRDAFLARASGALGSSLDYEATLTRLARLVVPELADMCIVDTVEADGDLRRLAAAHRDPGHDALLQTMIANFPPAPNSMHPVREVVRTGQSRLVPRVPDEMLDAIAHDAHHLSLMRRLDIRSGLTVPLVARGMTLGAIELLRTGEREPFGADDLTTAAELARRAALAIDNARLYREAQASREDMRRQAARMSALAEASRAFTETVVDRQTVLDTVARHVSELLGDLCVIRLLSEDGARLDPVSASHSNAEALALARDVLKRISPGPDVGNAGQVMRTGESVLLTEVCDRDLACMDPANHPYMERYGLRSLMMVPLLARGRVIGVVSVSRERLGAPYTDDDLVFLQELANRAAVAIDNARLYADVQQAETRYRTLFEGAADAILLVDTAGRISDGNPAATRLFGLSLDELRTVHVSEFISAMPSDAGDWEHWRASDGHTELSLLRRDGTSVPVDAWVRELHLPTGPAFLTSFRDISERRRLDRMQQEFVAMVTHELKGPLTSLKGFAQLMQRRGTYNAHGVQVILGQATHLERLIGDLLDAARLDAGRLELRRAPTDLSPLVTTVVDQLQATTQAHHITIITGATRLSGMWDADRITQVLYNLLSNAVKYSPHGGDICVRMDDDGDVVRVVVADHGVGIPPEALPRLFSRFYRVETSHAAGQGLGLGLYISRSLVQAHGGRIWVESTPGAGSTFTFTLPR